MQNTEYIYIHTFCYAKSTSLKNCNICIYLFSPNFHEIIKCGIVSTTMILKPFNKVLYII